MSNDLKGQILNGKYEIIKLLGEGKMGQVWQAQHLEFDKPVALKILRSEYIWTSGAITTFRNEARIIAKLEHPHVLTVYDFVTKEKIDHHDLSYLVMKHASSGTLADKLKKRGCLSLQEARRILSQIGEALDFAHSKGVIHLDLKPLNILFDDRGDALVADFGLAKLLQTMTHVKADTFTGTLDYMAKEQIFGSNAGPYTDVFALGIILHEMLTGKPPKREVDVVYIDESLPPSIQAIIKKATQPDTQRRYHSAGELADAFRSVVESLSVNKRGTILVRVTIVAVVTAIFVFIYFRDVLLYRSEEGLPEQEAVTPTEPPIIVKPEEFISTDEISLSTATLKPITTSPLSSTPILTQPLLETLPQPSGKIAYTSNRTGSNEIYLLDLNTGNLAQLTNDSSDDKFPSISPNGQKITFLSNRKGNDDIYLINIDGSNLVQLTDNAAKEDLPNWSPDGQRIVFTSDRDGDPDIYIVQVDTLEEVKLFDNTLRDGHPSLAPDGRMVVYNSGDAETTACDSWEIYLFELGSNSSSRLTNNNVCDWAPNWSPDGQRILFLSKRSDGSNADVYIMNRDGSEVTRLTTDTTYDWGAVWSPDGQWIAFTSGPGVNQYNLYILNLSDTEIRQLTSEGGFYPSWGPSN